MLNPIIQQTLHVAIEHLNAGRLSAAESLARQILVQFPEHPDALHLLGIVASQCNYDAEAADLLRRAIARDPANSEYYYNLGNTYIKLSEYELAKASLLQALALEPGYANIHAALGALNERQQRFDLADAACQKAIALDPACFRAHNTRGLSLYRRGQLLDAIQAYERALVHAPDFADAHWNLSLALLLSGNLQRGWQEWEWRWKYKRFSSPIRPFNAPLWVGQDLTHKTILLHTEQGLGDAIQCARYIPLVLARQPKKLLIECQPELKSLFSSIPGATQIFSRFNNLPPFDLHCPFMSLPRAFNTTLDNIPNTVPYLSAPPDLIAHFQNLMTQNASSTPDPIPRTPCRIGLVWRGSTTHREDHIRSLHLSDLTPLFQIPHTQFISLQLGPAVAQIKDSAFPLLDLSAHLEDFAHTAALIANLDLVISVDTAVAHLAGALAKPTWLLLPHLPDWRWLLDRPDSPWYPTTKLFRQPTPGNWQAVIAHITTELQSLNTSNAKRPTPNEINKR